MKPINLSVVSKYRNQVTGWKLNTGWKWKAYNEERKVLHKDHFRRRLFPIYDMFPIY